MSPKSSPSPSSSTSQPSLQSHHFFPHVQMRDNDRKANEGIKDKLHAPTSGNGSERSVAGEEQLARRRAEVVSVSRDGCRPQYGRDGKISVVSLENDGRWPNLGIPISIPSPNGMFKRVVSSLSRMSPIAKPGSRAGRAAEEDYWRAALGELSCKLMKTTRERDGALLEVSRLKYSMVELEKKLNRLEVSCHSLKFSLEEHCRSVTGSAFQTASGQGQASSNSFISDHIIIERFSAAASKVQKCVWTLSRLLVLELQPTDSNICRTISGLLQPYGIEVSPSTEPRRLTLYLVAFLNSTFFEDFESVGFHRNAGSPMLNPRELCESNLASYRALKARMTWQGVLEKGTRSFSGEFSRYCDRKMSKIAGRLRWIRGWPEPLLEAFFAASKSVWLVHLLANSVHPAVRIFRVDKGARFDPVYMEDQGRHDMGGPATTGTDTVWFMVAPGFYVLGSIVKCKVLCLVHD